MDIKYRVNLGSYPFTLSQVGIPSPGPLLMPKCNADGLRDSRKESMNPTNFPTTQCDLESLEEAHAVAPQVVFSV